MRNILFVLLLLCGITAGAVLPADSLRNRWQLIANTVGACAVNTAFVESFKEYVHEMRPNGEDNHSFPSRHTAWAFTASTVVASNLYKVSPWIPFVAQAGASGMGLQRVGCRAHWGSDVVMGASIGIISTEVSNIVCRRIFGEPNPYNSQLDNLFRPSLSMVSRAVYHFDSDICTGFATGIDFRMPLHDVWGLAAGVDAEASPVKKEDCYFAPLWTFTALAGPMVHLSTPLCPVAFELALQCGAARLCKADGWRTRSWAFTGDLSAALSWQLTRQFATRFTTDLRLTSSHTALGLSVASVVVF